MFCGNRPVTAEHVWPEWLAKCLPTEKGTHYRVVESREGATSIEERGHRYPITVEAKCVCETCNSGWMAELEQSAAPILEPLVRGDTTNARGKPWRWREWRQSIAATWALKTAMMLEHADTEELRTIPKRLYEPFYAFQRPPHTTQVWVARYIGGDPTHYGRGALGDIEVRGPDGPVDVKDAEPFVVALSVGQLAFRIIGHLVPGVALERPRSDVVPYLARIWPITPSSRIAEWPPPQALDNEGLRLLVFSAASPRP